MNNSLLVIIRKSLALLKYLIMVLALAGIVLLLSDGDQVDVNFSNLALVPENQDILSNYDNVKLQLKEHPELRPQLLITQTKINLENTSHFQGPIIIVLLILGGMGFFILEQLGRMVKTVEKGDPFVPSNVKRIYTLGIVSILVPVLSKILLGVLNIWIRSSFEFEGLELQTTSVSKLPWILTGILFFVLGKILSEGIRLREEQKLII